MNNKSKYIYLKMNNNSKTNLKKTKIFTLAKNENIVG